MALYKPAHCQFDRIQQRVKYAERSLTKHALQIPKIMACLNLSMAKVGSALEKSVFYLALRFSLVTRLFAIFFIIFAQFSTQFTKICQFAFFYTETLLLENDCPQEARLQARGKPCMLAYKRIDAKIAWPTTSHTFH